MKTQPRLPVIVSLDAPIVPPSVGLVLIFCLASQALTSSSKMDSWSLPWTMLQDVSQYPIKNHV